MAKKRIHQIAKELDIASADVLHKAKELGFEVKTASSGLVPEDEELLKLAFAEESSEQDIAEETSVEINEEATLTEEDQVIEKEETIDEVENVINESYKKFGKIDCLVNNAAGNFISPTERLSTRAFDAVIDIVLKGTINFTLTLGKKWIKDTKC